MNDEGRVICSGHDELLRVSIETRADVKHLRGELERFMQAMDTRMANAETAVRDLQIYGAKISQDNARDLIETDKRVDALESFVDESRSAENETKEIAAKIGGVVGAVCAILTVILAVFFKMV